MSKSLLKWCIRLCSEIILQCYSESDFLYDLLLKLHESRTLTASVFYSGTSGLRPILPLISKIGLHRATRFCDEPVFTTQISFMQRPPKSHCLYNKSYCEASEIGLERSQYVPFDNFKRKY